MFRMFVAAATIATQTALAAAYALASQGPGVGPGSAGPFQQFVATMMVAGLGAGVVVIALVLTALGGSREQKRTDQTRRV